MSELLVMNPRRRKRRVKSRRRRRAARAVNPRRRRRRHSFAGFSRRRRRRNPRFSFRGVTGLILPAATGAAGAVALDVALSYVPIPDEYKTGLVGTGVKAVAAVGLGWGAGKLLGKRTGALFTAGALTVIAYQVIRQFAAQALGDKVKGLSGYADFVDYNSAGGMGAYMAQPQPLGYMNPAGTIQDGMGAYMESSFSDGMGAG